MQEQPAAAWRVGVVGAAAAAGAAGAVGAAGARGPGPAVAAGGGDDGAADRQTHRLTSVRHNPLSQPRGPPRTTKAGGHLSPGTTYLLLLPPGVPLLFCLWSHLCRGKEKVVRRRNCLGRRAKRKQGEFRRAGDHETGLASVWDGTWSRGRETMWGHPQACRFT